MNIPLGISVSVLSSVLFGLLYYFSTWLHPLTGTEVFGWRMLLMCPCMTVYMTLSADRQHIVDVWRRCKARPSLIFGLCLSSALLGVQQWLFLWAPLNGAALNVSLGYFLLPLAILSVGSLLYRERLSVLQKAAAAMAAVGVGHDVFRLGAVSWETCLVAIGLPLYFVLRKTLRTDNAGGLWYDNLLALPVALIFITSGDGSLEKFGSAAHLYLAVPLLAAMSALAFICYTSASRLLPFSLFGLLGYVEPVLLFAASLLIGEKIGIRDLFTYLPIVLALLLLTIDGIKVTRRSRLTSRTTRSSQKDVVTDDVPRVHATEL